MPKDRFQRLWHVLYARSRFENVVHDSLLKKSMEVFLPKVNVTRKRRDRNVVINVPLFPGYLFVKTDLNPVEHLEIKKTVGVVSLVGTAEGPVSVPDNALESLKIMTHADQFIEIGRRIKAGSRVMVIRGPFTGVEGILIRRKGKGRVIVNIDPLEQFAGVEIDMDDIEALP